MSENLEGFINLSIKTESELFQAINNISSNILSDQASKMQYQMLSLGLYQVLKTNYGNNGQSK